LAPIYLGIVLMLALFIRNRNIRKKPYYKYYVPAVICKLIGGIGVCIVYTYYYKEGGDATNYFLSARTYVNVLFDLNFSMFFKMLNFYEIGNNLVGFDYSFYGPIIFSSADYYALLTVVLTVPFCILGLKSFFATTIVLAFVSFIGLWKLYEVFVDQFPALGKQFAIAIFFIPSVFFWGSGILKDTYTLSALGFVTYAVYKYLILKQRKFKYLILLITSSLLLILVKPYIFFAILPGSLTWVSFNRMSMIKNAIVKTFAVPAVLIILVLLVTLTLRYLGDYLGEYKLDNILKKAVKTQQDLIRSEQYGNNNYNIGAFEATISGIASKIPVAINMALFRPYIWDARNPVMVLSGLENLFMLGFSLYILFKVRITTLFQSLFSHPLLIFSFLFALFFAFSVGLTTANYGALVRLKIPCIPFYLSSLFILFHLNKRSFQNK
jgi:hypothetical protein